MNEMVCSDQEVANPKLDKAATTPTLHMQMCRLSPPDRIHKVSGYLSLPPTFAIYNYNPNNSPSPQPSLYAKSFSKA